MLGLNNKHLFFALLTILSAVIVAYSPSLFVPFYLDDNDSILHNQALHSDSLDLLIAGGYLSRIVGYASLWGNYQFGQLDPMGYHIFNIMIHLFNVVVVFLLARILIRSESRNLKSNQHIIWALSIACLWALHPLNSQPVIYIVQRLSSLAALFIFITIFFYLKARISKNSGTTLICLLLAMLFAITGAFTKQNFFVALIFLFCWEWFRSEGRIRTLLTRISVTGFIAIILIAPLPFMEGYLLKLDSFTRDPGATDRVSYFYTQLIVLWDYIHRFFIPGTLQLEIQVQLRQSFEPIVALALLGHVALIGVAVRFRKSIPLFFWGVLFFYVSHLVESFIFPIKDLAFEHRTYVGNFGLTLAFISVVKFQVEKLADSNRLLKIVIAGTGFLSLLGGATIYHRAVQWQDPLAFYEREVQYSPEHARSNASYGTELAKVGRFEEAEKYLKKSIDINLANEKITAGVLNTYMNVLYQQRKFQQAAPIVTIALRHIHNPSRRSVLLSNLAVGYIYMGYCDFALGLLEQAIKLNPGNKDALNNRNYCLQGQAGK